MPVMYDALSLSRIQAALAAGIKLDAAAGYVGGAWPSYASIEEAGLGIPVLSIAVNSGEDGDCLDVESGDATNDVAAAWFNRQRLRKSNFIAFYTSVSNANSLVATLSQAGIPRSAYWLWTAHYGIGSHGCSTTCYKGNTAIADATQWWDNATGPCDESVLTAPFLAALQAAKGFTPVIANPIPVAAGNPGGIEMANVIGVVPDVKSKKGYWIGFSDGAVWSMGGAAFHGSYGTLPAASRQATADFVGFGATGGGGYVLVHSGVNSNGAGCYVFGPE